MKPNRVLLFSGGMDSLCAAWLWKPHVLLYCDIGLPEQQREMEALRKSPVPPSTELIVDHSLKIGWTKLPNEIVPLRNLYFAMLATNYGDTIALAALHGDSTRDKDNAFAALATDTMSHVFRDPAKSPPTVQGGSAVLTLPFKQWTKTELVDKFLQAAKTGHARRARHRWLLDTRSCYSDGQRECGLCRSCQRKFVALHLNSVPGAREHFEGDPVAGLEETLRYASARNRGREIQEIAEAMEAFRG